MTQHHEKQLLDCLLHHASPELRQRAMSEVPAAYNAYYGREIVRVGSDPAGNGGGGWWGELSAVFACDKVLEGARARLLAPEAFTTEAFALDSAGEPLSDGEQIRAKAVRYDLLGAIEAASADVNLQALATQAVLAAHTDSGRWVNLRTLSRQLGHRGVLDLLERAAELARNKPWEESRFARQAPLPDGPPTREDWEGLLLRLQVIDEMFFGPAKECAGQYTSTPSMCDAVWAEADTIGSYLRRHDETVKAIERAKAREARSQARAQWCQAIRTQPLATIERSARSSAARARRGVARLARRLAAKRTTRPAYPSDLPF
jgi:hypothetical protein